LSSLVKLDNTKLQCFSSDVARQGPSYREDAAHLAEHWQSKVEKGKSDRVWSAFVPKPADRNSSCLTVPWPANGSGRRLIAATVI